MRSSQVAGRVASSILLVIRTIEKKDFSAIVAEKQYPQLLRFEYLSTYSVCYVCAINGPAKRFAKLPSKPPRTRAGDAAERQSRDSKKRLGSRTRK